MPKTCQNQSNEIRNCNSFDDAVTELYYHNIRFIVVLCTIKDDGRTFGHLATSLNTMWLSWSLLEVHDSATLGAELVGGSWW